MTAISLLLRIWNVPNGSGTQLRALRIDGPSEPHEVRLRDADFLVRIVVEQGRVIERCSIRHLASSREAYVQGGSGLRAFINECLLDPTPTQGTTRTPPS
jgi:hypothetical protein